MEALNKTCNVDGCNRRHHAHGYCKAHLKRVQRTGDPGSAEIRPQIGNTRQSSHSTAGMTPAEKLEYYTDKSAGKSGCWLWTGGKTSAGYGQVSVDGKNTYGHVLAYEVHNGPVPTGMVVRHKCDNRPCVNPAHLIVGTKNDNSQDMVRRGRSPRGERQGRSVLTEDEVKQIRRRERCGESRQALADEYGVTVSNIDAIVNRKSWRHVDA